MIVIKNTKWTDKEIEFLKQNIDKYTNQELADILDRSLDSVKMKIRYNKIVRKYYKEPVDFIKGEEWKILTEAPDYKISNLGRVCKIEGNYLKRPAITTHGYLGINLYINGKQKSFRLHRLVAKYFIPNPDNKPEVNHIDGNKLNSRYDNLEWVTSSENKVHAVKTGLLTPPKLDCENASKASLKNEDVEKICQYIVDGYTNKEISIIMGITKNNIVSQIRRRKTWTKISSKYEW